MGPPPDPAALRQQAARLRPGAVLYLYSHVAAKPKYHVLIAADERSIGFLINTQPSPFIKARPDRLRRHVLMPLGLHPFMHHDSYIACDDIVRLSSLAELAADLCDGSAQHKGTLHQSLHASILVAAAGSSQIADRDAALIVSGFKPPTGSA